MGLYEVRWKKGRNAKGRGGMERDGEFANMKAC